MSETKTRYPGVDLSPEAIHNQTVEQLAAWDALSDDQKEAAIIEAMDEAAAEGLAPKRTMAEIVAEARSTMKHAL